MIDDEKTAQDILAYLQEHPGSGDTVEGISRWWVLRQRINESVEMVRQVLEHLGKEGLVQARRMADGRTIYFADTQAATPRLAESEGGDQDSRGG
jgi:hypothetical protein